MKLLLDLHPDINKKLKFYKIEQDLTTLQDAVSKILYNYFYKEENGNEQLRRKNY